MSDTSIALERRLEARLKARRSGLGSPELLDRAVEIARDLDARRILDLGSGCGEFLSRLRGQNLRATGLDLCGNLLDRARRSIVPIPPLIRGDAERLPVASGTLDLVSCLLVVHYLQHPERALSEAARVLRPGGRLILADRITSPDPSIRDLHHRIERLRNPSIQRLLSSEELVGRIQGAGLSIEVVEFLDEILPLNSWLGGVSAAAASRIRAELFHAPSDLGGLCFEAPDRLSVRIDLILARKL